MPKMGISRFSIENLLFQITEKLFRGTRLRFRKFSVSKNVRDKRGGGYPDFPSKKFCLSRESFLGESFSVSLTSGIEKC